MFNERTSCFLLTAVGKGFFITIHMFLNSLKISFYLISFVIQKPIATIIIFSQRY